MLISASERVLCVTWFCCDIWTKCRINMPVKSSQCKSICLPLSKDTWAAWTGTFKAINQVKLVNIQVSIKSKAILGISQPFTSIMAWFPWGKGCLWPPREGHFLTERTDDSRTFGTFNISGIQVSKERSERGSNSRPSACKADVITTTPSDRLMSC